MVWLSVARRAYEVYDLCISSLIKAAADCLEKSWHVDIFTYSDVSPQQLTVSLSSDFLFRRKIFNDASSVKTVFLSKQWKCLWEVAASGCESKNSLVWFSIQDFFCDKFHESNPLKNINNWKEMSTEHVKKNNNYVLSGVFFFELSVYSCEEHVFGCAAYLIVCLLFVNCHKCFIARLCALTPLVLPGGWRIFILFPLFEVLDHIKDSGVLMKRTLIWLNASCFLSLWGNCVQLLATQIDTYTQRGGKKRKKNLRLFTKLITIRGNKIKKSTWNWW